VVIDEVITMLDIKLHKRAALKHMINKIAQLSITPEVKFEEWKKVALMAENNGCSI
jgi:predicted RNA-binding protein with PUA-like domain